MPPIELGAELPAVRWEYGAVELRDVAQAAEAIGYDFLFIGDHVLFAYTLPDRLSMSGAGFEGAITQHEALTLLAAVAGWTSRVRLTTAILVLPQRDPVLVAKQAAEIDILSGGRLRLGVGLGWSDSEFAALGASFDDRSARYEEAIALLRTCWRDEPVDFAGDHYRVEQMSMLPKPVTPGGPPILVGGVASRALNRAARLGDGWISSGAIPDDRVAAAAEAMRDRVRAAGRDPAAFPMQRETPLEATPGPMAAALCAYRAAGFDRLGVRTVGRPPLTPDDYIRRLEMIQREVWPQVLAAEK
ncbi:MAG: TIGR03619 family F420-dependent LLM class oxidoreductase [Chloroflexi bacterium]|nr:TIGR03619 family F420-dependent LLM class oxidoreductase [Chloroflexota bacterium]